MSLRVAVVGSGPAGFYAAGASARPPDDRRGRHDRAAADAVGARPSRCGARPPEDQGGLEGVREDRRAAGLPIPRQRRGRPRPHGRGSLPPLRRGRLRGRRTDRPPLGIPGEDLPGSWPATEFVAWYNGHPDFQELSFDLSGERAVVVGAGNVAIDVVRMLALAPEEIRPTDTTDAAIDAILGSGLKEIVLLGRRGPAQAAFTTPELKELGELADADVIVDPADLELDPASEASLETDTQRAPERRGASRVRGPPAGRAPKAIHLRFCVSPVAILGEGRVEAIEVVRNQLVADEAGRISRRADRRTRDDPVRDRLSERRLSGGRAAGSPVRRAAADPERGPAESGGGVYCAGWIKRGPSGVIGTNKKDATETIELLLEDARAGKLHRDDPTRDRGNRRRAAGRTRRRGRRPTPGGRRSTSRNGQRRAARAAADQAPRGTSCVAARAEAASAKPDARRTGLSLPRFGVLTLSRDGSRRRKADSLHGDSPPPGGVPQLWLPPRRPRGRAPLRSRRVPEVPLRGLGRERGALRAHAAASPRAAGRPPPPHAV